MKTAYRLFLYLFFICPTIHLSAAEKNIIFFITDDESPTLGCYGDPVAKTPAIDALAEDGTVFLNAFATTASCSASRSVVMSGLHNHANGQYGHQHAFHKFSSYFNVIGLSLPRNLAKAGYRTGHIGKYHVAPEKVFRFETYLKGNPRNAVQMAQQAREFISAESDQPFFLYFATSDPHRGGGQDKSSKNKLKPDLFGNKADRQSHDGVKEVFYEPAQVPIPAFLPDTSETREELAQYYQSVSRIDQGVARLIEILKENGLYEKTLIVFTSDHGMAFAGGKTTVYEGGLRVPFVVRNPYEKKRGVRHQALISHIDITPTLLDFAGALDPERNRPLQWEDPNKSFPIPKSKARKTTGGSRQTIIYGKSWLSVMVRQMPFIGKVFSHRTPFMRFKCITQCESTVIRSTNSSGISLTRYPIPLHPIFGQQVVFRHNTKNPYPLHMVKRRFANISIVLSLNFSELERIPMRQTIWRAIQNLQTNLKSTKKS